MKNKTLTFLYILLLLSSCRLIYPDIKYEPIKFGRFYFPTYEKNQLKSYEPDSLNLGLLINKEPNDSLSEFQNKWYSKHLNSLGEPILYDKTGKKLEIIRFTHLGTWSKPYSYRIEKKDSKIIVTYNKTRGLGGYKAGRRIKHKKKKVELEKWNLIISKMDRIDFWNIQTHDPTPALDGAEWILEVLINDRYHFVTRNSPDYYDGKDYAELCNLIKKTFN